MKCLRVLCRRPAFPMVFLATALAGSVPALARAGEAAPDGYVASVAVDGSGNVRRTWTAETYGIILGQAKVASVTTVSRTDAVDGSVTRTDPYTITFEYGPAPLGQEAPLIAARLLGEVHSTTTDAFGNVTESWTTQTYDIILGQAKLSRTTTRVENRSAAGTTAAGGPHAVHYEYDPQGTLIDARR